MDRCTPSLGRASGVQDPHVAEALDLRHVRVPVDDGVAAGEPRGEPRRASGRRPRNVDDPDPGAFDFDHPLLRQRLPKPRLVHVAVDGLDRPERPQLLEHRKSDEVAGVDDEVGSLERVQARLRQPPPAPRQVSVGDDREPGQRRQPTRKGRPTNKLVRWGFIDAASRTA